MHDPRHVEDVLNRNMPVIWRQEDEAKSENRKVGAGKAARTRAGKGEPRKASAHGAERGGDCAPGVAGWREFEAEGFLRQAGAVAGTLNLRLRS